MFYGWFLFSLTKEILKQEDKLSYCQRRLEELSEPIFIDDPDNKIFIFNSPSRILEILLIENKIIIRLLLWSRNSTENIIIYKKEMEFIKLNKIEDKKLKIDQIEIGFFTVEEMNLFVNVFEREIKVKKYNNFSREIQLFDKIINLSVKDELFEQFDLKSNLPVYHQQMKMKKVNDNSSVQKNHLDQNGSFLRLSEEDTFNFHNKNFNPQLMCIPQRKKLNKGLGNIELSSKNLYATETRDFISKIKQLTGQIKNLYYQRIKIKSKNDFVNYLTKKI